ncbi:MAG: hypothetical protein K9N23_08370 [Akkermansiaceae bacterium]|nr:hypothetical protein [Akkermansiaceae bacterium]
MNDVRAGKVPYPGDDIMVFDLDDGSFTPCPGLSQIHSSFGNLGATRCFRSKGTVSSSGCYLRTSCAVDENGLPTTRETGELDHVEVDFVRLCGSKCYLFELATGKSSVMRELPGCDHDMAEIRRFPLPPLPTGDIKYWYDMATVLELRQPANGHCLEYGSPGVASSLHEDPPVHPFWKEHEGAPMCCGVVVDSATAGSAPPPDPVVPATPPPARKRKKPDPGIPEIPERPGAHILCTEDAEISAQMKTLGEWLPFFRKCGVNLYGYIYNSEGEGDFSDVELKEMSHTPEVIKCIRLAATDDWHDPTTLAADLRRCNDLVPDKPRNSRSRKWILRELEHLIGLCDNAAASGLKVQLLAPPADCEDEDNWFDEGEDDDDEDE